MLKPGQKAPDLELPLTIQAQFRLADQTADAFTMLVFYRGKHCPICKRYLTELGGRLREFTDMGVNVFSVSMESEDRAMVIDKEWDTGDLPLAYNLTEDQAREWGLFISEGRPDSDEPDKFSEPGLFLLKPDRTVFFMQTQSAPFTRPPLDELKDGLQLVMDKDYPIRGTLT